LTELADQPEIRAGRRRFSTTGGAVLMAVHPNCNTHVLYYRKDLFDKAGLAAPAVMPPNSITRLPSNAI
jgi:ABC-type glycerol-3-phosphate transport system substrate-binding protein